MSRNDALAAYFRAHPDQWVSALELSRIAGLLAWRTRTSELRRAPYNLHIENRYRREGSTVVESEYRLVTER